MLATTAGGSPGGVSRWLPDLESSNCMHRFPSTPEVGLGDFGSYQASEIGNIRFHPKSALADFGSYQASEIGNIRFRCAPGENKPALLAVGSACAWSRRGLYAPTLVGGETAWGSSRR